MRKSGILAALAAVITAFAVILAGCGSDNGGRTGTDTEDTTPTEARDVIVKGLETMYTWSPAEDESSLDAYRRALPYLGKELRDGASNTLERGNSVWWQQWKKQKAKVTAAAQLVAGEHPPDTDEEVERSVMLTLTVNNPDGSEVDRSTLWIERVVAKKTTDKWLVEEISFFPKNPLRTAITTTSRPASTATTRQCPDGTTVPVGQPCSTRSTNRATTTRPSTGIGPTTTTTTTSTSPTCQDGQVLDSAGKCVWPPCANSEQTRNDAGVCEYGPCPEPAQTRDQTTGECPVEPTPCANPDQTRNPTTGVCEYPPCAITGQTRDSSGTCACPSGQVVEGNSCVTPTQCEGDLVPGSNGTCVCPAGLETVGTSCLSPCEGDLVRSGTTCVCPAGMENVGSNQCESPCPAGQTRSGGVCQYPPCPYEGQYRDTADGQCKCGGGRSTAPDGSCGPYVGIWQPPERSTVKRRVMWTMPVAEHLGELRLRPWSSVINGSGFN